LTNIGFVTYCNKFAVRLEIYMFNWETLLFIKHRLMK